MAGLSCRVNDRKTVGVNFTRYLFLIIKLYAKDRWFRYTVDRNI